MNFIWASNGISIEALARVYQQVLTAFYQCPQTGWYFTKLTLQSPMGMLRLLRFAL